MKWIEKFWNKDIAGHPLNWLILLVMTIIICHYLDLLLTATNTPKPITAARAARKGNAEAPRRAPVDPSANADWATGGPDDLATSDNTL